MGNRLLQVDSSGGAWAGPSAIMSYSAKGQLFFSMTKTASVGTYDYNWHWYDGQGLRVITHVQQGGVWSPGTQPTSGNRTYYVYDGHDVALMLRRNGGSWSVLNRFLTGGLDQPLAGWFNTTSGTGPENLALIGDYQGSTRAAVRADGSPESQASYYSRNAFGSLENASGAGGSYNTATGFGGASTPNSTGGFTYLRNRWYDAATGRFLTQDPIGMAGGVNLYAYAGSNPVAFSDPFGLCTPKPWCWIAAVHNAGVAAAPVVSAATTVADIAVGFTPGASAIQDATIAATGRNLITGDHVGAGWRLLAAGSLLATGGELHGVESAMQRFANKYGAVVHLVGSRASGTAHALSDFDYIVEGDAKVLKAARRELPRGVAGGELGASGHTGIDILDGPLDPSRPHVTVKPQP